MMSSPPSAVGTTADELLVRTSVYPEVTFDFFLFDMESNTPATTFKISLSEQTIYVNSFGNTC